MNPPDSNSRQQFSCRIGDKIDGTFDLIELAGLLREGLIDGNTPICEEGTKDWCPLRERPEYRSVQAIPIEAIARHLHEKERAGLLTPNSGKTSSSFIWAIVGCVAVGSALMYFWSQPPPPPVAAPPPAPPAVVKADWPVTKGDHFSVKCPVLLKRVQANGNGMVTYRGFLGESRFGLEATYLPGLPDAAYQQIVDEVQARFSETRFRITPGDATTISGAGYQGQEVSFVGAGDSVDMSGKMRIVFGKGSIITMWGYAKPDKFSPEDINRFLTSLEVW